MLRELCAGHPRGIAVEQEFFVALFGPQDGPRQVLSAGGQVRNADGGKCAAGTISAGDCGHS
jgi:hypothetical protein